MALVWLGLCLVGKVIAVLVRVQGNGLAVLVHIGGGAVSALGYHVVCERVGDERLVGIGSLVSQRGVRVGIRYVACAHAVVVYVQIFVILVVGVELVVFGQLARKFRIGDPPPAAFARIHYAVHDIVCPAVGAERPVVRRVYYMGLVLAVVEELEVAVEDSLCVGDGSGFVAVVVTGIGSVGARRAKAERKHEYARQNGKGSPSHSGFQVKLFLVHITPAFIYSKAETLKTVL